MMNNTKSCGQEGRKTDIAKIIDETLWCKDKQRLDANIKHRCRLTESLFLSIKDKKGKVIVQFRHIVG